MSTQAETPRRKRSAMEVLRELRQPKVAVMLALGFSSGLPFLLTASPARVPIGNMGCSGGTIGFPFRAVRTSKGFKPAESAGPPA